MKEELLQKSIDEITELKKEQDRLIIEKGKLCASCREVEQVVDDAYQHIYQSMTELTVIAKAKRLGEVHSQLQLTNNLLNSLVYPDMPPEQISERKNTIEEFAAQFESMEQEENKIADATNLFRQSVVQDDQLEQLAKQAQEAETHLTTLNMSLRTMPLMIQITRADKLKDLQQ